MNQNTLALVTALRHELHSHPELSMQETWTKKRLMEFLREHTSLELVDRGSWFYAVRRAQGDAPTIAFRADFDAIAMDEGIDLPYGSTVPGVAHKCGHDGHSATLVAFAMEAEKDPRGVNIVFLFQPGEENAGGAKVCTALFDEVHVDEIYGLHNWPNPAFPVGSVGLRDGTMYCASKGLKLLFTGAPAHASQPETGKNPTFAMAEVLNAIEEIYAPKKYKGLVLCTPVYMEAGEKAFGIAAAKGQLWLTCRGQYESEMDAALNALLARAEAVAEAEGLQLEVEYDDVFPETLNHKVTNDKVRAVCEDLAVSVVEMDVPIRSSEDFGWYTKKVPGTFFLLGVGDVPTVHTSGYDFDDSLIPLGVKVFKALAGMPELPK